MTGVNDLGFGSKKSTIDLAGFDKKKPSENTKAGIDDSLADKAAEKRGFVSREPAKRVERVRRSKEPYDTAYIRASLSVINRFKQYCNENDMTHGEALDEFMKKSGI